MPEDMCPGFDGSGIRPDSPAHSGMPIPEGFTCLERCDACAMFEDDFKAALSWAGSAGTVLHRVNPLGEDVIAKKG